MATHTINEAAAAATRQAADSIDGFQLSEGQQRVYDLAMAGRNVFGTGSGGSGKSAVLRRLIADKRACRHIVEVTGPVGMAAVNVGGITLHRLLGCGLANDPLPVLQAILATRPRVVARWRAMRTLVIDEVSMLEAGFMHKCDQLARWMRGRLDVAFGGIQLVLFGDFAQLPPILDGPGAHTTTATQQQQQQQQQNPTDAIQTDARPTQVYAERPQFCFELPLWVDPTLDLQVVDMRSVFRQTDSYLVGALNRIRFAEQTPEDEALFRARVGATLPMDDGVEPTRLCPRVNQVTAINTARLEALAGEPRFFNHRMEWHTEEGVTMNPTVKRSFEMHQEALEKHTPAGILVTLKVGAQVVLLSNLDTERGLANGARGVVVRFATASEEQARFDAARRERFAEERRCRKPAAAAAAARNTVPKKEPVSDDVHAHIASFAYKGTRGDNKSAARAAAAANEASPNRLGVKRETIKNDPDRDKRVAEGDDDDKEDKIPWQPAPTLLQNQPGDNGASYPVVAFACGVEARIVPHKWHVTEQGLGTVELWQVPLLMAWAMTIHKCQGMSLDRAVISMGGIFDYGQAYVALSRIRSLDGLSLDDFEPNVIRVHPRVLYFYRNGYRAPRCIAPLGEPLANRPTPNAVVGRARGGRSGSRGGATTAARGRGARGRGGLHNPGFTGSSWGASAAAAGGSFGHGGRSPRGANDAGGRGSYAAARAVRGSMRPLPSDLQDAL